MTSHDPDLDSASDWLCRVENLHQIIRNITQIRVVTRHQCGISPPRFYHGVNVHRSLVPDFVIVDPKVQA